jgi:hypothetical protein
MNCNLERHNIVYKLRSDSTLVTTYEEFVFYEPKIDYLYHYPQTNRAFYLQLTPTVFRQLPEKRGFVELRDVNGIRRRIKVVNFTPPVNMPNLF